MKLNFTQTIIAIALSLLIAYGFYSFHDSENKIILTFGSFIFLAITLGITIGVRFERSRTTTNIRTVSGIFSIIAFFSNLIFSFLTFSTPGYVIVNGMLFLVFSSIVYSINKAKQ